MIVVTGTAPRTGTSAMMRLLLEDFKPHSFSEEFPEYVARSQNPEGFWDLRQDKLVSPIPHEEGTAIKLWAPHFELVDVSKVKLVVVMSRPDFKNHVESMVECGEAEGLGTLPPKMIADLFLRQDKALRHYFSNTPQLHVEMETLRQYPKQTLNQIREML